MQTVERPRFREDLVAELIEDGGARFIDVADPDSGQMFRFFEVEYSLACAMDGERDVNGIVKWAEEELGLKPSATEVRTVISTLGSLGYLDSGKAAAAAATEPAAASVAAAPVETPRPAPVEAEPPARPTPPSRKATPPAGVKTKTPASGVKKQPEAEKESFNRWDQPTAMGDPDDYLDKGVVAGSKRPHTPVPDVELGHAGGRSAARGDELPKSEDMELGAPGVSTPAAAKAAKGADVQLGHAGAAGVSTDLAADMAVSPADVKAAVRASQVMKAADVPPELAAELEPAAPVAKPAAKQPEAKPVAKQPEAAKPVEKQPEKKPIQLPTERPVLPQAPPAPGPNKLLIALLVIVVLGGIGFAVWKFVLNKKDTTETSQKTPTPPPPQPTPPPPPPVESAKLAAETSPPEEIKPAAAVQIATIIATDTEVKEGDTIAKLVGFKPSGDKVAMYEKELGILKGQLADAEKARDAAANDAAKKPHETKIIGLNKMIPDREAKLATARTELEKFLIKSPGAGKVTTVSKANARVTPTDIVATLQRAPLMVATFKTAPDATADAKVLLAVKGGDQKLSCIVVATGGDGTKIACPADSAPEGTEVTYAGLDTSTPSEGGTEGSAAPTEGSAAPTEGSAAPTEGSAAPTDGSAAAPADGSGAAPVEEKAAPAPKAQPRRPAPKKAAPAPAAPATEEKASNEKLFPPGSAAGSAAPATP